MSSTCPQSRSYSGKAELGVRENEEAYDECNLALPLLTPNMQAWLVNIMSQVRHAPWTLICTIRVEHAIDTETNIKVRGFLGLVQRLYANQFM